MLAYILQELKMETARLFYSGNSQAVRLPKEYRFDGDRVYIKRLGNAVILLPFSDPWRSLLDSLNRFSDDFMATRPQGVVEERATPFS
ncbi:type II toxin-antitoxin system antitoxin VapB [Caldilinea sp.]|jgi:antitoxin VapB|uniref:type II toxin-antitoxin system antitoxin VapB n=1 Tax=Caldilinea sp. TaxID=2293560 RepID=UPI003FA572EE